VATASSTRDRTHRDRVQFVSAPGSADEPQKSPRGSDTTPRIPLDAEDARLSLGASAGSRTRTALPPKRRVLGGTEHCANQPQVSTEPISLSESVLRESGTDESRTHWSLRAADDPGRRPLCPPPGPQPSPPQPGSRPVHHLGPPAAWPARGPAGSSRPPWTPTPAPGIGRRGCRMTCWPCWNTRAAWSGSSTCCTTQIERQLGAASPSYKLDIAELRALYRQLRDVPNH
jgi:hypothetical protein